MGPGGCVYAQMNRLYWQCRRGMLELDLLLLPFYERYYAELSAADQVSFERLLACHDRELYQWLVQRQPVSEPFLQGLVERVIHGY